MQNDPIFRIPKPSHRQRRVIAMGTAAAIVVVGLGAFALLPPVRAIKTAGTPTMVAATTSDTARAPRMLENGAPFSFADLVERVSPAVVTITVEEEAKPQAGLQSLPPQLRQFFDPFGQGGGGGCT